MEEEEVVEEVDVEVDVREKKKKQVEGEGRGIYALASRNRTWKPSTA